MLRSSVNCGLFNFSGLFELLEKVIVKTIYANRFRSVQRSNRAMSWNALDISMALFPVLPVL